VLKVGEGQATMQTVGTQDDLLPSVMRKEGSKQARYWAWWFTLTIGFSFPQIDIIEALVMVWRVRGK